MSSATVQVSLAAVATDHEVVVQERERALQKRDADPLKAIANMATLLGGKIVLVQAVRLILTVCLLVSSGAAFYSLITYTSLNVPVSLAIVVAANVTLAVILLLIVVLQRPKSAGGFGGLAELLGGSSKNKQTAEQLAAMLPPAFEPYFSEAVKTIRNLQVGSEGGDKGDSNGRRFSRLGNRSGTTVGEGLPLVESTSGLPGRGTAIHAVDVARATANSHAANAQPRLLGKVAETGKVLIDKLPQKHRRSQVMQLAASVLTELKEFSQQQDQQQHQPHHPHQQQQQKGGKGRGSREGSRADARPRAASGLEPVAGSRSTRALSHHPSTRMYVRGGDMHSGELL
jgi:hypothetical protein